MSRLMPGPRFHASVEAMLNTLEHERYARSALAHALADDLGAAVDDRAPDSTRALIERARSGAMVDGEVPLLLAELRALAPAA